MPVPTIKQRIAAVRTRVDRVAGMIHQRRSSVDPLLFRPTHAAGFRGGPLSYTGSDDGWAEILPGSTWGTWQTHFEMRSAYSIPADWDPTATIGLYLPLGDGKEFEHPEALVAIDDRPEAAVDIHHPLIVLPDIHKRPGRHTLRLTGWTGIGPGLWGGEDISLRLGHPAVVLIDRDLERFVTIARAALSTVETLDELHPAKWDVLVAVEAGVRAFDLRHPLINLPGAPFRDSVATALTALTDVLGAAGPAHPLTVHGVGHAHIDTAWLWTTQETRGKVARTFHTVLHLMDAYPEYIFVQSQPQLYAWFRDAHPGRFADIQRQVRAGRWEPIGGMWIEADCNVTGAESLIRQFVLGRAFFDAHFGPGAMTPILWLPDAFGFPASLPQIAALAGMQGFFTIKLRWNEINEFPYDTFWWRGIDGTRLLAHMSTIPYNGTPTDLATYNADPSPSAALYGWARQIDKHQRDVLMSYGWGDGGGGPTRDMLDRLRILREFPGVPRHRLTTVRAFYDLIERRYGASLPTWDGELYLETHQGTLTSQWRIKDWNHRAEVLLHDTEFVAACARLLNPDYTYPHAALRAAWEIVCLNQFHDILPGSSVGAVYEDAGSQFAALFTQVENLQQQALTAVAGHWQGGFVRVNPADSHIDGPQALGPLSIHPAADTPVPAPAVVMTATLLQSDYLRVELNPAGDITRIYDRTADRDLLPHGSRANLLQAFEDRPALFDAWNVEPPALTPLLAEADPASVITVTEPSPGRLVLTIQRSLLGSPVTQEICFNANGTGLEFTTTIDWQSRFTLVRAAFPLALRAREARYGIQWGYVTRPLHSSTSWDAAQYEVAHHGWIDVSESDYGVSLLTAGLYGSGVIDGVVALTLVKRASSPDPAGDRGPRVLRYALLPHSRVDAAASTRAARAFGHPVLTGHADTGGERTAVWSPVQIDHPGVQIETIKISDDDQALIVRLYEVEGTLRTTRLRCGVPVAAVHRADIYETPLQEYTYDDGVELALHPFEIVTMRLTPARAQ